MAQSPVTLAAAPRAASAQVLDYAIPAVILLSVMVVLAPVPAAVVDLLLAANLTQIRDYINASFHISERSSNAPKVRDRRCLSVFES